MKQAIDSMFVVNRRMDCSGRLWLKWYQRWRVDFFCWLLGHSLWRFLDSVVEVPQGSGWRFHATICLRCGKGGHFQQDYYHGAK